MIPPLLIAILGWVTVGAGIVLCLQVRSIDQQLQRFRLPDTPDRAFRAVATRWRRHLYAPEGHPYIIRAWCAFVGAIGLGMLGGLLIAIGTD